MSERRWPEEDCWLWNKALAFLAKASGSWMARARRWSKTVWGIRQRNKPWKAKLGWYFLGNRFNMEFIRMEGVILLVKGMLISALNFW